MKINKIKNNRMENVFQLGLENSREFNFSGIFPEILGVLGIFGIYFFFWKYDPKLGKNVTHMDILVVLNRINDILLNWMVIIAKNFRKFFCSFESWSPIKMNFWKLEKYSQKIYFNWKIILFYQYYKDCKVIISWIDYLNFKFLKINYR